MTTQYVSYSARGNSGGGGGGTVTSVGLSLPSIFTVTGSPVTSSGTLTGTFTTEPVNTVFAGPSSGPAATPTFRALVVADIPALSYVSSVSGTAPISSSGGLTPTISISQATTSTNGYLSSTDWNTFNGKQAAGNYLTALTGDITATGPGSATATLATVNSNTGSFGSSTAIPSFTVNGKGLITAASTSAVVAPAGTLSGTTLNSTVVSSSLTSVGTISTGTWAGTTIGVTHGGTGLTTLTSGSVIVGAGTSTPTFVAPGTSGNVLTSSSGSWISAAPGVANSTVTSQTGNYSILTTDSIILFTTGTNNLTATLPTAVGVTGKMYTIKKIDNTVGTGTVALNTTSGQTIDTYSSGAIKLSTWNESFTIVSDGSNWQILEHKTSTPYTLYAPTIQPAGGSGASKGTGYNENAAFRRIGKNLELYYSFYGSGSGQSAGTGGGYVWSIPAGLTVDTTALPNSTNSGWNVCGPATAGGAPDNWGYCAYYDASGIILYVGSNNNPLTVVNPNFCQLASGIIYSFFATLPIAGWLE